MMAYRIFNPIKKASFPATGYPVPFVKRHAIPKMDNLNEIKLAIDTYPARCHRRHG